MSIVNIHLTYSANQLIKHSTQLHLSKECSLFNILKTVYNNEPVSKNQKHRQNAVKSVKLCNHLMNLNVISDLKKVKVDAAQYC